MKKYLEEYQVWLDKYDREEFLAQVRAFDFDLLKDLSMMRVVDAEGQYGQSSYDKSACELKREAEEEVADMIFYLYLLCKK